MCWPSFEAYPMLAGLVEADRCASCGTRCSICCRLRRRSRDTKLAFVTNPNNPTGTVVGDQIEAFFELSCRAVSSCSTRRTTNSSPTGVATRSRVERTRTSSSRTPSKAHWLRVGYAAGSPGDLDRRPTLVPFAVNELAQIAAPQPRRADRWRSGWRASSPNRPGCGRCGRRGGTSPNRRATSSGSPPARRQRSSASGWSAGASARAFAGVGVRSRPATLRPTICSPPSTRWSARSTRAPGARRREEWDNGSRDGTFRAGGAGRLAVPGAQPAVRDRPQ